MNSAQPDCGSSSCIFSANGGMRTNGPCRCYENAGFHGSAVMAAKQMLREVLLLRAARLDAMPHDRTWTKDKPTTPGKWRVSIVPEKRTSYAFKYVFEGPVSHCSVVLRKTDPDTVQLRVSIDNAEDYRLYSLTDPWFDGALWMRDEHPADPFADPKPRYSQDDDLP